MKIRNKSNGVEAEVPESLAEILINAGGWESAAAAAAPVKQVRRTKKSVEETDTEG